MIAAPKFVASVISALTFEVARSVRGRPSADCLFDSEPILAYLNLSRAPRSLRRGSPFSTPECVQSELRRAGDPARTLSHILSGYQRTYFQP